MSFGLWYQEPKVFKNPTNYFYKMNENQFQVLEPFSKAASIVLQGPVFEDQTNSWNEVLKYEPEIVKYFGKIGLDLIVDKREGYAFLKQSLLDETGNTIGLVRRVSMSYEQSLVCVLLREWLMEFEMTAHDTKNLYITPKQFRSRLEVFFKDKANELKFIKELNRYMVEMERFKFLKLIESNKDSSDDNRYEVKRIIKARISLDEMERFLNNLNNEL